MGTCGACKHWAPPQDPQWSRTAKVGFGQCQKIQHPDDENALTDLALASDAEGYNAWLECKPEFGCLLYEAVT